MRKQIWCRAVGPVLIAALAGALLGCSSQPPASSPGPASRVRGTRGQGGRTTGPAGSSSQDQLTQLGVIGGPSQTEPRGLLVRGFAPSSEPSALEALGVKEGDVILSCNGERQQMSTRLIAAVEGLQTRGEPITLEVVRDGQRLQLERTEKLPGAVASQGSD